MPSLTRVNISAAAILMTAALVAARAQAVSQSRTTYSNPVGLCQAALPTFEGQVRKRPLAVQNEGASNAFITCSFESQTNANVIAVYVSATDGVVHEVSCTGVSGTTSGSNQYLTKTVAVASTGAQSVLQWNGLDFGGAPRIPSVYFSISCNLVPGVGINNSYVTFPEDVGM